MRKLTALACGLVLASSGLAMAQVTETRTVTTTYPDGTRRVSQIIGSNIRLQDGTNYGRVEDVVLDDDGNQVRPLATEVGFWRPVPVSEDGTNVELLLSHPTGVVEMYAGVAEPAKVELRTDGVMRSPFAKEYTAAHRMYGYVNSDLLWVMDMAAVGQPIQSHVSAELKRVE